MTNYQYLVSPALLTTGIALTISSYRWPVIKHTRCYHHGWVVQAGSNLRQTYLYYHSQPKFPNMLSGKYLLKLSFIRLSWNFKSVHNHKHAKQSSYSTQHYLIWYFQSNITNMKHCIPILKILMEYIQFYFVNLVKDLHMSEWTSLKISKYCKVISPYLIPTANKHDNLCLVRQIILHFTTHQELSPCPWAVMTGPLPIRALF